MLFLFPCYLDSFVLTLVGMNSCIRGCLVLRACTFSPWPFAESLLFYDVLLNVRSFAGISMPLAQSVRGVLLALLIVP